MPCEPRPVVVLTKEAYQRLRNTSYGNSQTVTPIPTWASAPIPTSQPVPTPPPPPPVPPTPPSLPPPPPTVAPIPPIQSTQTNPNPQPISPAKPEEKPQEEEPDQEVIQEEEKPSKPRPVQGIGPRYRKSALATLAQLEKIRELTWNPDVRVRGQSQGITITQLLRLITVPFTRGRIPTPIRELLDKYKIKIRNHIAAGPETPEWHQYFKL